jgi:hypothetical protein
MSKLLYVCGIVLAAVGLALVIVNFTSPGQMQIYGLTFEAAAILLTGGLLCLGLSNLIQIQTGTRTESAPAVDSRTYGTDYIPETKRDMPAFRPRSFDLGTAAAGTAIAGAAASAAEIAKDIEPVSQVSVAETIEALEQAKSDIKAALGASSAFDETPEDIVPLPVKIDSLETAAPPSAVSDEPEVKAEPAEPGLFVVEEQTVRGKPARILSDGTVEAETDEGWMRFENMEHLNEYLDSIS